MRFRPPRARLFPLLALLGFWPALALAQPAASAPSHDAAPATVNPDGNEAEWMQRLALDPHSSASQKYAQQQKARVAAEKSLRKIRAKYFGRVRNATVRQEGIVQLREFVDPALFPSMIRIFEKEGPDVRNALLDHFQDSATPEGDAALAWEGIFDTDADIRASATSRVRERIKIAGSIPNPVRYAVFEGLKAHDNDRAASAARLAAGIDMYDAIPWMIARLVTGQPVSTPQSQTVGLGNNGGNGALAWIMVGQQTAFVSDLTPVVSNSAVAFDPQLSVVNEGVILRVMDAAVITYHVDMYNILSDFTQRAWGAPTKQMGWNTPEWGKWYREQFLPDMQKRADAAKASPAVPSPK